MWELIEILSAIIIGAFAGKFMGVVVNHLPVILLSDGPEEREPNEVFRKFLEKPYCRKCHHAFSWAENIPVIGYLVLKGQCPDCRYPLTPRNFWIELGISILFGLSALFFSFDIFLAFVLFICCILVCCFITDYDHSILPDQFTMTLVWTGLIASLFPLFVTPQEAIIGAIGGYGVFWFFNVVYYYFRGFDGMYPGDFKLNAGIGACLGWKCLMVILLASMVLLLGVTLLRLFLPGNKTGVNVMHQESPYGCYSSIVTAVVLFLILGGVSF